MKNNRIYSIVLSVVIAFGLWLYVVNNVSQEDDVTFYNLPVVMAGESKLNEQNLMITGISSQSVSVNLSGTRSDLNKLNSGNVVVKVDLSQIEEPGENIPLTPGVSNSADVPSNAIVVESKSPTVIYVDVDYRRTKEVPVQPKWTGTRSEDYIYDTENAVLDYPTVTISGPAAVADLIDHAEVEVDLTERDESISESFRYTLCDVNGDPVDAEQITTNVEAVQLDVPIQRIKEVKLVANVIYGGGASEENTVVTLSHESIRLSGGDAVLAEFGDTYTVATINLSDVEKSDKYTYTLNLPEGVTNQTGVTEVTVSVRFTGLVTKEFTVENIQSLNVPEGRTAEIINANLTVKVRGPAEQINRLTAEDITATVDFSAAEIGTSTYKATIVFGEEFPDVGALKTSSVTATVQEAEE